MMLLLRTKRFIPITQPIRRMISKNFPKLLRFCSVVSLATLCKRLFPSADGIIKNISINANASAHIPVYVYHCAVGK